MATRSRGSLALPVILIFVPNTAYALEWAYWQESVKFLYSTWPSGALGIATAALVYLYIANLGAEQPQDGFVAFVISGVFLVVLLLAYPPGHYYTAYTFIQRFTFGEGFRGMFEAAYTFFYFFLWSGTHVVAGVLVVSELPNFMHGLYYIFSPQGADAQRMERKRRKAEKLSSKAQEHLKAASEAEAAIANEVGVMVRSKHDEIKTGTVERIPRGGDITKPEDISFGTGLTENFKSRVVAKVYKGRAKVHEAQGEVFRAMKNTTEAYTGLMQAEMEREETELDFIEKDDIIADNRTLKRLKQQADIAEQKIRLRGFGNYQKRGKQDRPKTPAEMSGGEKLKLMRKELEELEDEKAKATRELKEAHADGTIIEDVLENKLEELEEHADMLREEIHSKYLK